MFDVCTDLECDLVLLKVVSEMSSRITVLRSGNCRFDEEVNVINHGEAVHKAGNVSLSMNAARLENTRKKERIDQQLVLGNRKDAERDSTGVKEWEFETTKEGLEVRVGREVVVVRFSNPDCEDWDNSFTSVMFRDQDTATSSFCAVLGECYCCHFEWCVVTTMYIVHSTVYQKNTQWLLFITQKTFEYA